MRPANDEFEGWDPDVNFDFTYFDLDDKTHPIPEKEDT